MAEHDGSGVTLAALEAETMRLVGSIVSFSGGGSHPETTKAVRDFLIRFCAAEIPWLRMYKLFPAWQALCGLLDQEWDRDAVLERARVIFTLISTHGATIKRMALGGGTWKGTGAETIGDDLVLTKLYYKRDGANRPREEGFTVFEFHLRMELQPRVTICVLHRTDYRHAIRDLREYIHEGYFPGRIQPNMHIVQCLGSINSAPVVGGHMNGPMFDHITNQASENETNYGHQSSFLLSEIPPAGVDQFSEDQILESIRYYHVPPGNSSTSISNNNCSMNGNPYDTRTMGFGYDRALSGNSMMILSNASPMNGNLYDTSMSAGYDRAPRGISVMSLDSLDSSWGINGNPYETSMSVGYDQAPHGNSASLYITTPISGIPYDTTMMLPEPDAHTDQVSMQNESSITSFGNSMGTPNQNVMTGENDPWQPDTSTRGEHLVSTAQNYPEEHFSFPVFSEHNSTFETNYNELWAESFHPAEYYWAATANYP